MLKPQLCPKAADLSQHFCCYASVSPPVRWGWCHAWLTAL